MKKNTYAPVVIPTLNRYDHFRRCVESLASCKGADNTELIIGLDYPPAEKYVDGYRRINEYVDNIKGFRKVTILRREKNYGPHENWESLKAYAFSLYDSVIMTEDDNEFSPLFLDYINQGLNIYKDNPYVTAICGYNPPIFMNDYPYNIYASYGLSCWGVGFWKKKKYNYQLKDIEILLKKPQVLHKVYKRSPNLVIVLIDMIKQKKTWGDTCWPFFNIVKDSYSIFPKESFVRNLGHDGSGVHCGDGADSIFINQPVFEGEEFHYDTITIEETKQVAVRHYIRKSYNLKKRILLIFKLLNFYLSSKV